MAVVVNFEMHAGNSILLEGEILNNGVPIDLTGATIRWWIARDSNSGLDGVLLMKDNATGSTAAGGITITNAALGLYTVSIERDDTIAIPPYIYHHEVELIDSDNAYWTPTIGSITIKSTVISKKDLPGAT